MTREELTTAWEEAIAQLTSAAAMEAERIIHAQLLAWHARFPRHHFSAWDSMGMFCIEVSPPVLGQDFPDHIGSHEGARYAALNDLLYEVRVLTDWYNAFDSRASIAIQQLRSSEQLPATVQ